MLPNQEAIEQVKMFIDLNFALFDFDSVCSLCHAQPIPLTHFERQQLKFCDVIGCGL